MIRYCVGLILAIAFCFSAWAQGSLVVVNTRNAEKISYWWMPQAQATVTVVLFSGGSGGMGLKNGVPESDNFLVRSRDYFARGGVNVAIIGNPTDKRALDDGWRTSEQHLIDVKNILSDIQAKSQSPIWLVGTSRGTISVAALAIQLQSNIAGIVLTASVASPRVPAAVTQQSIQKITVPTLVYHHEQDACRITTALDASKITNLLSSTIQKKWWGVNGGKDPSGDPCEALHWHGFIGMEVQAVEDILSWIKQNKS